MEQRSVLPSGSAGSRPLTPDEVAARLAAAPRGGLRRSQDVTPRGDHDLNPGRFPDRPLVPAAVLVPLVVHPTGLTVLFTLRTPHLSDHAGQISFPGGRIDPAADDIFDAQGRSVSTLWQLWPLFLGLAIALNVAELVVRKWGGLTANFRRG